MIPVPFGWDGGGCPPPPYSPTFAAIRETAKNREISLDFGCHYSPLSASIRAIWMGQRMGHGQGGKRLSALTVSRVSAPGMYPDGLGLYLRVGPSGAKSWVFRYRVGDSRRDMGLGPLHTVSLAEARDKTAECRKNRFDGIDPLERREAQRLAAKLEAARAMTFSDCADAYIQAHAPGWRNGKHADQWRNTLSTYANPVFGRLPVQEVNTALVMKVLEPIWTAKTETASRLRGRIRSILDWATAREFRRGENPARWRGTLRTCCPDPRRCSKPSTIGPCRMVRWGSSWRLFEHRRGPRRGHWSSWS